MKFGIEQFGNLLYCANCKNLVSSDSELKQNYCAECGAPLTQKAIEQYEVNIEKQKKQLIVDLIDFSNELRSDSFKELITKFIEQ